MPNAHYDSAFARFYSQVQEIHDTPLGQELYDARTYQSSNEARRLLNALDKLYSTVCDIRSDHGSQGPSAVWNPKILARHQPFNDPNGQTPPRTPSPMPQVSALEIEIEELKKKTEKSDMELDKTSFRLEEYREKFSEANDTIESLRYQLALEYKSDRMYDLAAEQFDSLSRLKEKQVSQKKLKKDEACARLAEEFQLRYIYQKGNMLLQDARYAEAEHASRHVLERRKKIHNDDRTKRQHLSEAQLQLCTALRSQIIISAKIALGPLGVPRPD